MRPLLLKDRNSNRQQIYCQKRQTRFCVFCVMSEKIEVTKIIQMFFSLDVKISYVILVYVWEHEFHLKLWLVNNSLYSVFFSALGTGSVVEKIYLAHWG